MLTFAIYNKHCSNLTVMTPEQCLELSQSQQKRLVLLHLMFAFLFSYFFVKLSLGCFFKISRLCISPEHWMLIEETYKMFRRRQVLRTSNLCPVSRSKYKVTTKNCSDITLRHGCSPVNLLHVLRTLFLRIHLKGCFY